MKHVVKYELLIYSQSLEQNPVVVSNGMDIEIRLVGFDLEDNLRKCLIRFKTVLCNKHTFYRFTLTHDSYDRIVEFVDSEWLAELKRVNMETFLYWNPKHYAVYLYEDGLYEFIAQGFEVIEYE